MDPTIDLVGQRPRIDHHARRISYHAGKLLFVVALYLQEFFLEAFIYGKPFQFAQSIQVGEKIYQDYKLVATNPGGHSSQPVRENAIYAMSDALLNVGGHELPA